MSLARYLSKLAGLVGSDGKVPTSALSGIVGKSQIYAGAVLQVAQARKDTTWSNSTTSFAAVDGLSVTLTPTSANSRFLVEACAFVGAHWWSTSGGYFGVTANGVNIAGNGGAMWTVQYGADVGNSPYETQQWSESAIYTPGSASPVTFNVVLASGSSGYPIYVNRSYNNNYGTQGRSSITVTEIAG